MLHTDEEIKNNIYSRLESDPSVDSSELDIQVDRGHVILTGSTPTFLSSEAAQADILTVPGVITVKNNIEVVYSEAGANHTDSEITANAQKVLTWSPDIDVSMIETFTLAGVVTLKGTVDDYWRKVLIEGLIENLPGVKSVINEIVVVPTGEISDESIAQNLINQLEREPEINMDKINIVVENGEVVLTGEVEDLSIYKAINNIVFFIKGIRDFKNNLIIQAT